MSLSTVEECLKRIQEEDGSLLEVPEHLRKEAVCLEASKIEGVALEHVPDAMKTEAFCLAAVQSLEKYKAPASGPEPVRSQVVCLVMGSHLGDVLEILSTEARCIEAVKHEGAALQDVPETFVTEALCLLAVIKGGYALHLVPEIWKTEALCVEALRNDGQALQFCLEALQTEAFGFKTYDWALEYVPEVFKTEALCLEAFEVEGTALEWVPEPFMTEALCHLAVHEDGKPPESVPLAFKTEAFYISAIKSDPSLIRCIPDDAMTTGMCLEALDLNEECALDAVPDHLKEEVFRKVLVTITGTTVLDHALLVTVVSFAGQEEEVRLHTDASVTDLKRCAAFTLGVHAYQVQLLVGTSLLDSSSLPLLIALAAF